MKHLLKNAFVYSTIALSTLFLTSCNEDEDPGMTKNIVEVAGETSDASILVSALSKYPDLVATLSSSNGTYTVFAPNNAAFTALLGTIGQTDLNDIPENVLRSILEYHVLATEVKSTDLSDGLQAATVNGESITVTEAAGSFTINGAGIEAADVETSNGVIHIIDAVLVPADILAFVNTILEPAYFNKNFSTLMAAINASSTGLQETLLGEGNFTVFAPTNDAFAAAGITALPTDQAVVDQILKYHVVQGAILAEQLPATQVASPTAIGTVEGSSVYLSNNGGGVFLNGNTQVTSTDILPGSGDVIHVINRTLTVPSQDIVEIAIEAGFSKLAEALTEAGLVSTLQGDGPFTVFAPTDAAFDALYSALGVSGPAEVDDATLEAVLLYHVLGVKVFSTDLEDGLAASALNQTDFTVNIGTAVTISDQNAESDDATITDVNILGTNGVIHILNSVILPN